ncbi:MAG: AraC family transcriptional regulator [Gammaproteobacteria bacterium]|nr:AraC family transcriptional regulator [Gammaproteobacteria bacterium]
MNNHWQSLINLVEQCWQQYGADQPLEGLNITRSVEPVKSIRTVYRPSLCVVLAGAKQSALGHQVFHYRAGECLLTAIDVPVSAQILDASEESPYLAFSLALNQHLVAELISDAAQTEMDATSTVALHTAEVPDELVDPLIRLMNVIMQPRDIPVLAPLIEREIIWRLLNSQFAAKLKQIGLRESHTSRISRATRWLRENFDEPVRVSELAEMASMSVASFHRHFKSLTQLTPVQFQKQMRLQEARRLLLLEPDVARVGFQVGYESASQFSRDYRKLFGLSPGQDRKVLREQIGTSAG